MPYSKENVYRTRGVLRITKTITALSLANLQRAEIKGQAERLAASRFTTPNSNPVLAFSPNDQINFPMVD